MEAVCVTCGIPFKRKSHGYNRYSLLKVTTYLSAKNIYPNLANSNGFMCADCCKPFRKYGKLNHKRQYVVSESVKVEKVTPVATIAHSEAPPSASGLGKDALSIATTDRKRHDSNDTLSRNTTITVPHVEQPQEETPDMSTPTHTILSNTQECTLECLRIPPVVQNGKNKLVCASSALHDQWMCSENSWLYKLPKNSATTNKLFELAKIQGNRARARRYFCSDCINKVSQLYPAVTEPWNTTEEKNSYYMRTEPRWPSGRFDKNMKNASCVNIGQCKGDWISIKEQRACITDESVAGYLIHCYKRYGHLLRAKPLSQLNKKPIRYSLVDLGDKTTKRWNDFKRKYNTEDDGDLATLLMDKAIRKYTPYRYPQIEYDEVQRAPEDNTISHNQVSGEEMDTTMIPDLVKSEVTQQRQYPEHTQDYDSLECTTYDSSAGCYAHSDHNYCELYTGNDDNDDSMASADKHVDEVASKNNSSPLSLPTDYVPKYDFLECTALDGSERDIESDNDEFMSSADKHVDEVANKNHNSPLSLPSDYVPKYDFLACTTLDGSGRDIESDNDDRMASAGKHVDDVVSRNDSGSLSLTSEYSTPDHNYCDIYTDNDDNDDSMSSTDKHVGEVARKNNSSPSSLTSECATPDGSGCDVESDNDDRMASAGKHVGDVESEHDVCMSPAGDHVDDVARKNNAPLSLLSHLIEIKPEPDDTDDLDMECCSVHDDYHQSCSFFTSK